MLMASLTGSSIMLAFAGDFQRYWYKSPRPGVVLPAQLASERIHPSGSSAGGYRRPFGKYLRANPNV